MEMHKTRSDLTQISQEEVITLYLDLQAEHIKLKQMQSRSAKPKQSKKEVYDKEWSRTKKILYILAILNRPVTSTELLVEFTKYDDRFDYCSNKAKSFSTLLSRVVSYKTVCKVKYGGFRTPYYCLPQWFDDKGNLLELYRKDIYFV